MEPKSGLRKTEPSFCSWTQEQLSRKRPTVEQKSRHALTDWERAMEIAAKEEWLNLPERSGGNFNHSSLDDFSSDSEKSCLRNISCSASPELPSFSCTIMCSLCSFYCYPLNHFPVWSATRSPSPNTIQIKREGSM